MLRIHLLREVKVYRETEEVNLGKPQVRQLLTLLALALAEGRLPAREWLISRLWDEDVMPADPEDCLNTLVSSLRRPLAAVVPGDPVRKTDGGYLLAVDREQVDVPRFRDKDAEARRYEGKDDEKAVLSWRAALSEWGTRTTGLKPLPLAGTADSQFIRNYRRTLQMEHRDALIGCLRAEMRLARHAQVLPELNRLYHADGRADEDLAYLLMLAYHRAGRQVDALDVFKLTAEALKEFDATPERELMNLRARIVNRESDPGLAEDVREVPSAADDAATRNDEGRRRRTEPAEPAEPSRQAPAGPGPVFNNVQFGTYSRIYQAGYMHVSQKDAEDE